MYGLMEDKFECSNSVSNYITDNYSRLLKFAKATLFSMYGSVSADMEVDLLNDVYLGVVRREDDGDYVADEEDAVKIVFSLIKKRAMNYKMYTTDGSGAYFLDKEDGSEREDICGEIEDIYGESTEKVVCTLWDIELADRYMFMNHREDEVQRIINTLVAMLGEYENIEHDKSVTADRRRKTIIKTLASLGLKDSPDDFKETIRIKFAEALGNNYIV